MLQIFLLILIIFSRGRGDSSLTCKSEQKAISKIVNSLGFRLENLIDDQKNYFFSPLSITIALGMVYIGARGSTREQISDALDFKMVGRNCLPNKISESFRELILSLESEEDNNLFLISNGAFIQTGYKISQFYTSNLNKFFRSTIQFLNFAEEGEATMDAINEWVANNTKGKIVKLLNEPLDPLTIMVLVNAVYFKGLWDLPFNENLTRQDLFYKTDKTTKVAQFMTMDDKVNFYYDKERKYTFLELYYLGGNISMIIILPENLGEFPQFTLTNEILCNLRSVFEYKTVSTIIPKFSIEFKRELSKDMINLGMEELFSDRADLSGIREQNDLHVSLMVHKAVIEVNEKGSEASAISGIGIDGRKPSKKETFWANHPFLFYIIHRETDTILFSGRVVDP